MQMAMGYSAVLFGLIAVACVTSKSYCVLPGVCFSTYEVPTPWRPLRLNLAPFVMMGVTQCVVRRSSLLGHLSGSFVHGNARLAVRCYDIVVTGCSGCVRSPGGLRRGLAAANPARSGVCVWCVPRVALVL